MPPSFAALANPAYFQIVEAPTRKCSISVPSIPAIGLVLVLTVDWFIGMARAFGDLIGNCVAIVVAAAWEGDLDHAKARQVLDGEELVDVTAS